MAVDTEFLVGPDVKHPTSRVIRPSCKSISIREKHNWVYIALMAGECLNTVATTNIPQLSRSIASSRNEGLLVWGEREWHDVPCVACKGGHLLPSLYVPQYAGHVPTGGQDLIVIQKSAATQIPGVAWQLSGHANCPIAVFQVVNWADIVQAPTRDKVTRGGICTRHHPGWAQGNSMDLVCRITVPHNQFSILRGGDQVSWVSAPVHGVHLG